MRNRGFLSLLIFFTMWGCFSCGSNETLVNNPTHVLQNAKEGDCFIIAEGTYQGPWVIPPGVSLSGEEGKTVKLLSNDIDGFTIKIETERDKTTTVNGLWVVSNGDVGVLVVGDGKAQLTDVHMQCSKGIGVAAEGQQELGISNLSIEGTITPENANDVAQPVDYRKVPAIGLIINKLSDVEIDGLTVVGMAAFGVVVKESLVHWQDGIIDKNLGIGVLASGTVLDISNVSVTETLRGESILSLTSIGMLISGGSTLTTSLTEISNNTGFALVQDASTADHDSITIKDNSNAGMWVQNSQDTGSTPTLNLHGTATTITGNMGIGVGLFQSGSCSIENAEISSTGVYPFVGENGTIYDMGDGLQAFEMLPNARLAIKQSHLGNNQRIGILLNGDENTQGQTFEFDQVTIDGTGQYGLYFGPSSGRKNTISPDGIDVNGLPTPEPGSIFRTIPMASVPSVSLLDQISLIGENALIGENGMLEWDALIGENGLSEVNTK